MGLISRNSWPEWLAILVVILAILFYHHRSVVPIDQHLNETSSVLGNAANISAHQIQLSPFSEFSEVAAADVKKLLVMASLKAPEMPTDVSRAPISISAVIDKSGSMADRTGPQQTKLQLTQQTLDFVIDNLGANDEFGIVTYSNSASEHLPLSRMDAEGKKRAHSAVRDIHADGWTHLSAGLFAGINQLKQPSGSYGSVSLLVGNEVSTESSHQWTMFARLADGAPVTEKEFIDVVHFTVPTSSGRQTISVAQAPFQLQRTGSPVADVEIKVQLTKKYGSAIHAFTHSPNLASPLTFTTHRLPRRNEVSTVWMFTDGQANVGITGKDQLVTETTTRLQGMSQPTSVFTFGFGEDHDGNLLKGVADAGRGMYYYIKDGAAVAEAFADCLGGLLTVMARDIKLTVTAQRGCTLHQSLASFESHVSPTEAWVKLPDLYSEEERDLLFEVEVPATEPSDAAQPIVSFQLEYYSLLQNKVVQMAANVSIARPQEARPSTPHPKLDAQRNRLTLVDALERSKKLADEHRMEEARSVVEMASAAISASPSYAASPRASAPLLEDLAEMEEEMADEEQYGRQGNKRLGAMVAAHANQRSAGVKGRYLTTKKAAMVSASAGEPAP